MQVSASQAAWLVDRHERVVRGRVYAGSLPATKERGSWRIEVDDLSRLPGWHVDRGRLAQLEERSAKSVESLTARVASLERELRDLRARLRTLEQRGTPAPSADDAPYPQPPESHPSAFLVQQAHPVYGVAGAAGTFNSRSAAGRFLARHGVAEATARSWWKGAAYPTEPAEALADALRRAQADPSEWRNAAWRLRLHQCTDDPACACHELLAGD